MRPSDAAFEAYTGEYAEIYDDLVAGLRTKREQYSEIAGVIVPVLKEGENNILEIGPSKTDNLRQALVRRGIVDSDFGQIAEHEKFGRVELYGLEYFPEMINSRDDFSVEMVRGDVRMVLPFADNSFDVVVINSVLLSIDYEDLEGCMKELSRVIRPNGALILSELDSCVGEEVSGNVLKREVELMSLEYGQGFVEKVGFYFDLGRELWGKYSLKKRSDSVNRVITASHDGFDANELMDYMGLVGLQPDYVSRTYAGSYHLLRGRKV